MSKPSSEAMPGIASSTAPHSDSGPGATAPVQGERDLRVDAARHLIKNHVIAAMSLSVMPVPILDLLLLSGLQLRLVRKLARLYDLPFHRGLAKSLIAAVLGGALPTGMALSAASLAKSIPGLGTTVGVVSISTLGGAATYAVGHAFLRHFATGGSLLSFDPDALGDYARERFREGAAVARQWRSARQDHNTSS